VVDLPAICAKKAARLADTVLLPTPPFWLVIKILRGVAMGALANKVQIYLIYII
jgi:hypothetical protein